MTLSTNVYVLDEVSAPEVFHFCQELLTRYDDRVSPQRPTEQRWTDEQDATWRNGESFIEPDNPWTIANEVDQGLPAWLLLHYRPGRPLRSPEEAAACEPGWCDPDCNGDHGSRRPCWLYVDFDTAYSYRDKRRWGCGDLHAVIVAELGQWLDAKGVRWEWQNEFTSEVHGGDDRYERLIDLCSGGFEAAAWYRTTALPAILGHIANESGGAS